MSIRIAKITTPPATSMRGVLIQGFSTESSEVIMGPIPWRKHQASSGGLAFPSASGESWRGTLLGAGVVRTGGDRPRGALCAGTTESSLERVDTVGAVGNFNDLFLKCHFRLSRKFRRFGLPMAKCEVS